MWFPSRSLPHPYDPIGLKADLAHVHCVTLPPCMPTALYQHERNLALAVIPPAGEDATENRLCDDLMYCVYVFSIIAPLPNPPPGRNTDGQAWHVVPKTQKGTTAKGLNDTTTTTTIASSLNANDSS